MTIRQAARDQSAAATIMAEAVEIWELLVDPDGRPLASTAEAYVEGIAPAAACYLLPLWAREQSRTGAPLWWIWPDSSWGAGPSRRHELLLAAALGLAALEHHTPPWTGRTLTVVPDSAGSPAGRPRIDDRRPALLQTIEQARAEVRDYDGLDPATSSRPAALEALTLAAGCYFLPEVMREMGAAEVPNLWAWPTKAWIQHDDRAAELITGVALALAAIELVDASEATHSRTLSVIVGGAPNITKITGRALICDDSPRTLPRADRPCEAAAPARSNRRDPHGDGGGSAGRADHGQQ